MVRSRIEYHLFPRHETCTYENCRSRKYYLEDGQRFCKAQGHRQEGFVQEASDEDNFGLSKQGRTTRKKKEVEVRESVKLKGREALGVWVEGLQLLLRFMVGDLGRCLKENGIGRKVIGGGQRAVNAESSDTAQSVNGSDTFQLELESVLRNLWSLRLRAIKGLDEDGSSQNAWESDGGGFSSQGNSSTDDLGSGTESIVSTMSTAGRRKRKRTTMGRTHNGVPEVKDLLGICYMACILLRLPVSLGDMHEWVTRQDIVYTRAVRKIPEDMLRVLPTYYTQSFEPPPLKFDALHKVTIELSISFAHKFDLVLPSLNAPLLMYKHVKSLLLPLEVYIGARNLGHTLGLKYEYPTTFAKLNVSMWPEVQIMSLIVIATKLTQNLDGADIIPFSASDPSSLTIDWQVWARATADPAQPGLKKGSEMEITWKDVDRMDNDSLDDYLNWYGENWTDVHGSKMPSEILDMFPLSPTNTTSRATDTTTHAEHKSKSLHQVQSTLIHHPPQSARPEHDPHAKSRPGTRYRIYKTLEELSQKGEERTKLFYEKAAEIVGVEMDTLVRGVAMLERKLEMFVKDERKRKRAEEWEREEGEGSDEEEENEDGGMEE